MVVEDKGPADVSGKGNRDIVLTAEWPFHASSIVHLASSLMGFGVRARGTSVDLFELGF